MILFAKLTAWIGLFAVSCWAAKQPNVVFILTDDQDWEMKSLDYMPLLRKYVIDEGTLYDRHYCTVSICCPSRVNLWTGQAAHNTNVTDLNPPYGGYPKFIEEGLNQKWLPIWLQELGYNTYYTGKLMNSHNIHNYASPPVNGFNGSDFLLDPYTYEYFNAQMTSNGAPPRSYKGQYSPDVVAEKAYSLLEEATQHSRPFFLAVAPIAPHSNLEFLPEGGVKMDTPRYAQRHAHLFKDYQIPRTPDFNPDVPSGVSWVKGMPKPNDTVTEYYDEFQRARLRSLQAVDEMVEQLVQKLEAEGLLENTYVFYTTDNGYHIGQHRMHPGKECPFETDIHIPLAVRGPGIPAGHTAGVVSSHTDLTPTILKLAGLDRPDLDGAPIPLSKQDLAKPNSGEHVNVEYWVSAIGEGRYSNAQVDIFDNATGTVLASPRVLHEYEY
jgi:arylsulfatase A-like enzyme